MQALLSTAGALAVRLRGLCILLAALVAAVLLACIYFGKTAPGTGDVSVVFLGLTNNPGGSAHPQRLYVVGGGRGLHALFAVTNITRNRYVNFGIAAVEIQASQGWRTVDSGSNQQDLAHGFSPGYGYRYAVPWPAGAKTGMAWRLRLWVTREPKLVSIDLHHRGFGLKPYGRHTVTSDVVTPLRPGVAEPGASVGNAQPQDGANDEERGRAHLETERP